MSERSIEKSEEICDYLDKKRREEERRC